MELKSETSFVSERNVCVTSRGLKAVEDDILVSAAKSGDTTAFNELYSRHSRKILPRIYRITKNREDAEDVLQEAALRAFLHMKGFEGRASFSSWLTRIAINSALMVLRKRRVFEVSIEQMSDDEESSRPWEPSDNAETPEARYARCEREELLINSIQRLPYAFREVIDLQRSDECSTTQIAEELGISLSATKSRLMRARKTLRRLSKAQIHAGVRSNATEGTSAGRIHGNALCAQRQTPCHACAAQ